MMAANPRQQRLPAVWIVDEVFGKWQALLAEPAPPADRVYLNGAWHYFRGSAFTGLGEIKKAESELEALADNVTRPGGEGCALRGKLRRRRFSRCCLSALSGEIAKARGRAVKRFSHSSKLCGCRTRSISMNLPIGHNR